MREIKYRAWVESIGQMNEVIGLNFKKEIADFGNNNERPFYTLDLMQYTGLRDKNGKEIYEGDIIILHNSIYKVLFNEEEARFVLRNDEFELEIPFINGNNKRMEVIGNIYENPKLLGGKNE